MVRCQFPKIDSRFLFAFIFVFMRKDFK